MEPHDTSYLGNGALYTAPLVLGNALTLLLLVAHDPVQWAAHVFQPQETPAGSQYSPHLTHRSAIVGDGAKPKVHTTVSKL